MDKSAFTKKSPGQLKPTTFTETKWRRDHWESEQTRGYGFVPDPLPPKINPSELLVDLYGPIVDAERNLSLLEGTARRLPNPHLLVGVFSRREAILSSAIEDTFASAEELALFDFDPSTVDNRDPAREVSNYVKALEHGLNSKLPICLRLIREMHALLLQGVNRQDVTPGEFRNTQNAIGPKGCAFKQARFVPPPPDFIPSCLDRLEQFINAQDTQLPRLVRFALIHYQFEAIHPFLDGNGRLGRLLVTLMICRQGQLTQPLVYVSGYFEQHREVYYDLLYRVSVEGVWTQWVQFFLVAVATQANDAVDRADRLLDLQADLHQRVRRKQSSALLPKLIDELFMSPAVTLAKAQRVLDCSTQTASNLIGRLVEHDILVEATGRRHGRVFVCRQILDLINR